MVSPNLHGVFRCVPLDTATGNAIITYVYIYKYYIIVKVTVVGTLSYLPTECRAAVKPCFSWSLKSPLPPTADSCRDRGRRRELTVAASPNSHTTNFLRLQTL